MNTRVTPNEIELAVLCPTSPITTNPHSDTKVCKHVFVMYINISLYLKNFMKISYYRVANLMEFLNLV